VPRLPVLEELVAALGALPLPARVAVDGVDAAGKTMLADDFAVLPGAERLCTDDFLQPPEVRYRQGRESPSGYYEDSFDYERLRVPSWRRTVF
jgi:uridine kinase